MKNETADIFGSEDFLTATPPSAPRDLEQDEKILLEQVKKSGKAFDIETPYIEALHQESQTVSKQTKQEIAEKFQSRVTPEDRASMAVDSLQEGTFTGLPTAKELFADVITLGDYRENVRMYGHTWTLRGLNHSDILDAADDVRDTAQSNIGFLTSFTFSKLVYSLDAVDGRNIYELLPDIKYQDYKTKVDYITAVKRAIRAYLLAMPDLVIDGLIAAYNEMEQRRNAEIVKLKNS